MWKISTSLALIFSAVPAMAQTVTTDSLKKYAECIAATHMVVADQQIRGNFDLQKKWAQLSSMLMDKFYNDLAIYAKGNIEISKEYGRWPNIEVARYASMTDLAQARYVQQVLETNRCLDIR